MKYLLISCIWAAYCILHSYLISIGFTKFMMRLLKQYFAFYRLFYVFLSVVLLIPVIQFTVQSDHVIIIHYTAFWSVIRYMLISGSLIFLFWAFFLNYDSLSFFGIRQILDAKRKKPSFPSGELKRNGLLGIVRHPMYFALIIILWCNTFKLSDIVVNTVLTLYILIGTKLEERKLVMEFGDVYIRYQQEVPMLIPFSTFKGK